MQGKRCRQFSLLPLFLDIGNTNVCELQISSLLTRFIYFPKSIIYLCSLILEPPAAWPRSPELVFIGLKMIRFALWPLWPLSYPNKSDFLRTYLMMALHNCSWWVKHTAVCSRGYKWPHCSQKFFRQPEILKIRGFIRPGTLSERFTQDKDIYHFIPCIQDLWTLWRCRYQLVALSHQSTGSQYWRGKCLYNLRIVCFVE